MFPLPLPLPQVNSLWKRCPNIGSGLQQELAAKIAHLHQMEAAGKTRYPQRFVSAEGLGEFDGIHFNSAALRSLGQRYSTELLRLVRA